VPPRLQQPTGSPFRYPRSAPLLCSDNYILDGHHRWSQTKLCPLVAGCAVYANPKQYAVHKANKPCADIITLVQQEIDYNNPPQASVDMTQAAQDAGAGGKTHTAGQAAGVGGAAAVDTLEFAFGGFLELETRFGRTAHKTAAQAEAAYVQATRDRLAAGGIELKGGDEALREWWRVRHAERIWGKK